MAVAFDALTPGIRECDYAARIIQAQVEGTPEHGGTFPSGVPFILTGEHAGLCHGPWTADVIAAGSSTALELGGCYQRYHAALCRTISLGKPSESLVRVGGTVREGLESALAVIKTGVTCHDVWAGWRRVLERSGLKKNSRIGYSLGLAYAPTWRDYTLSLESGRTDELREGMCLHVITGMWAGDGSKKGDANYELSETVLVTKNGFELLTNFDRSLLVKN
jgi:Xaa-Pro dipeptidase